MNFKRYGAVAAMAVAGTMLLTSCAANEGTSAAGSSDAPASDLAGDISASGASSQQAAQEAWVAEFQGANPDVTINYDPTGSGTGRENFIAGSSAFIGSDRAYKTDEIAEATFGACAPDSGIVELPLYISPIAVIFNLEGIDTLNLDAATIANIFNGTITNWNDPAIAASNEGVELPDLAISPVHRQDDSGTTENFTAYLNEAAPEAWTNEPDGVWPLEGGEAAQGTSGVVDAVKGGQGTIGYADASRAGDLGTVAVQVADGSFVEFSPEAAAAVVDASGYEEGRTEGDLAIALDRAGAEAGTYPVVLVSYLIACEQYEDANTAEVVKAYLSYIASEEGQQAAADNAGSAPISDTLRTDVEAALELIS
ncbi:phosphate ABC transporter substrate-binding protein PstS [Herbiconiux sp. SYSU D00978]|uniref:phosphate ABC transporter substrate-binding protein PstS n=1 Tax=Herbiconiux sp. SYSU D00978 TaxID=2812562 RepID=UPI0035AB85F3